MECDYCYKHCAKGKQASKEFLDKHNSVYEAVSAFWAFTEACFKTCPFKEERKKAEEKN